MKLKLHCYAPFDVFFVMISFIVKVKLFSLWPKTMDYNYIVRRFDRIEVMFSGLFTPHWKVLRSSRLHHSDSLAIYLCIVCLLLYTDAL